MDLRKCTLWLIELLTQSYQLRLIESKNMMNLTFEDIHNLTIIKDFVRSPTK